MRFIRLLLFFEGAFARVLHLQRRRDDEDFREAMLIACGPDDARDAWIDWQSSELSPEVRQLVTVVHGPEFKQCFVAVSNRVRLRRFKERELFNRSQSVHLRLQDHVGEVRPQNLGSRESLAAGVVLFRIETDANARPQPSAAPRPLIGRRPRDRFNR